MNSATATAGERRAYYEGAITAFFASMSGTFAGLAFGRWFFG